MTQLIINGTEYPQASNDKYKCYKKDLGESLRMASGRLVFEKRGQVTVIEYSYDYFGEKLMRRCLADLRSGSELEVSYLSPERNELVSEKFRCTQLPSPSFAFSRGDKELWHNISFTLEGCAANA